MPPPRRVAPPKRGLQNYQRVRKKLQTAQQATDDRTKKKAFDSIRRLLLRNRKGIPGLEKAYNHNHHNGEPWGLRDDIKRAFAEKRAAQLVELLKSTNPIRERPSRDSVRRRNFQQTVSELESAWPAKLREISRKRAEKDEWAVFYHENFIQIYLHRGDLNKLGWYVDEIPSRVPKSMKDPIRTDFQLYGRMRRVWGGRYGKLHQNAVEFRATRGILSRLSRDDVRKKVEDFLSRELRKHDEVLKRLRPTAGPPGGILQSVGFWRKVFERALRDLREGKEPKFPFPPIF